VKTANLALVRHGESEWNRRNLFTGWTDVDLSPRGVREARAAGWLLRERGFEFDVGYASFLKRAVRTLWLILEEMDLMWLPVKTDWRLNERHYGALTGKNKAAIARQFGDEQVRLWRRSFTAAPPPAKKDNSADARYAGVKKLPCAESLADTLARVLPCWRRHIAADVRAGRRVLVAAHGNSLRALVKHLDEIPDDKIAALEIPTGVPLLYDLDKTTLRPRAREFLRE
jgi:2,3-bisphosphoglycerate-dependent phosphoglycerate mutase